MLADVRAVLDVLEDLSKRIERTQAQTFLDKEITLADGLIELEMMSLKRNVYESALKAASLPPDHPHAFQLRMVSTLNVQQLYYQLEQITKDYHHLNSKIQQKSWNTELLD